MRFFFYAKFRHSVEISYCITQILHEINLEDSRSSKSAILTHLKAQNFEFLHFLKAAMHQISKIQSLQMCYVKMADFEFLEPSKLISCKI